MSAAALVDLILRQTAYMTLATGDGDGLPWASPVWFAVGDRPSWFDDDALDCVSPEPVHER
jgi:hypothetical protein